jgi:CubicO group peptidase (beta-lactamase class C family)
MSTDRSDQSEPLPGIGRRMFIGGAMAATATALIAPANAAGAGRAPRAHTAAEGSPRADTLVRIPPDRVPRAVAELDRIIKDNRKRTGVPGIAAAVVHHGRLLYAQGFGVRDVGLRARVTKHTVFRLASVSKSVSATVVAGIVGRELARWDDPIVGHLPSFALGDPYVTGHVTIADLFNHRSGLPDHAGDLLEDLGYGQDYVLRALRLEPLEPFRATYAYTNFGLTAAAVAAAAAAGRAWPEIADEILFHPVGMTTASFRYADFVRHSNRAQMHVRVDGRWHHMYNRDADPEAPAGGASGSVLDLAKWMVLLLADGVWNGQPVIRTEALDEAHLPRIMASPPRTRVGRAGFYGFGTNVGYDDSGRLRLSHSGGFLQGAATSYTLLPDEQLGIVTLTNGMPIGIPEAINATFLDLVVAGAVQHDWLDVFDGVFAGLYVNKSELAGKPGPAHPAPAQPAAFYLGAYENDYYGPIEIVAKGPGLHLLIGPQPHDYPLRHWDGDVFSFFPTGENAVGISAATFTPDAASDRAAAVTLDYYDTSHLGTFTRPSA